MAYREGAEIARVGMGLARTFMDITELQARKKERARLGTERKDFEKEAGMTPGEFEGRRAKIEIGEQEDLQIQRGFLKEIGESYTKEGIIEKGVITQKGWQAFLTPTDKTAATGNLKELGPNAYNFLKAQTQFTSSLIANKQNETVLRQFAMSDAKKNYEDSTRLMRAAEISNRRGEKKEAAQILATMIEQSIVRRHASVVEENGVPKIQIYETVGGERQEPVIMSIEEALAMAQSYTRETYTMEAATNIIAGQQMNIDPKEFILKSPEGKQSRVIQIYKSTGAVEYMFFNPDGTINTEAPDNLEEAYKAGWEHITPEKAEVKREVAKEEKVELKKTEKEQKKEVKDTAKAELKLRQDTIKHVESSIKTWLGVEGAGATPEEIEIQRNLLEEQYKLKVMEDYKSPKNIMVKMMPHPQTGEPVYFNMDGEAFRDKDGQVPFLVEGEEQIDTQMGDQALSESEQRQTLFKQTGRAEDLYPASRDPIGEIGTSIKNIARETLGRINRPVDPSGLSRFSQRLLR